MALDGAAITVSDGGRKSAVKDPDATVDFVFDWSDWLADVSDTYVGHQVLISNPTEATIPLTEVQSSQTAGKITIFVAGGTAGQTHALTCRIITPARSDDRTLYLKIRER